MRQFVVVAVADADLDPEYGTALLDLAIKTLVLRQGLVLGKRFRDRGDWARLGHAPYVQHLDAVVVLQRFHEGTRASGTSD